MCSCTRQVLTGQDIASDVMVFKSESHLKFWQVALDQDDWKGARCPFRLRDCGQLPALDVPALMTAHRAMCARGRVSYTMALEPMSTVMRHFKFAQGDCLVFQATAA